MKRAPIRVLDMIDAGNTITVPCENMKWAVAHLRIEICHVMLKSALTTPVNFRRGIHFYPAQAHNF